MPDSPTSYTLKDPSTGKPLEFNVPAPTPGLPNPQAIAQAYQNAKIKDAEKAVAAAIQFQGLRGYQQALQAGEPSEKALTRYAPMMFYTRPQAIGPAIRAVTPPQMTPFQQATIEERKKRSTQPMIRQFGTGGVQEIDPVSKTVKVLNPSSPTGKPDKFSAVVGQDIMGNALRLPVTADQFQTFMESAPPNLRTNSANVAIQRILAPPSGLAPASGATNAPSYQSPDDVRAAFKANKIDRNTAKKILTEQFGMK